MEIPTPGCPQSAYFQLCVRVGRRIRCHRARSQRPGCGAHCRVCTWSTAGSPSSKGADVNLHKDGYEVLAVGNPLRSLTVAANYVLSLAASITGPVVLVSDSYGRAVISEAVTKNPNAKSLVFVGAFAPDAGESVIGLSGQSPGSTSGPPLALSAALSGARKEFYFSPDKFHRQFAAAVSSQQQL